MGFSDDNTTQPANAPLKIGGPPPLPWPGAGIEFKPSVPPCLMGPGDTDNDVADLPPGLQKRLGVLRDRQQQKELGDLLTSEGESIGLKVANAIPTVVRCRVSLVSIAHTIGGDVATFWTDTPTPRVLWPSDLIAVYDGPVCVWRRE